VLPLVGSTITDPSPISPSRSAASTIATPSRSLTDPPGLKYSSFATTSAPASPASLFSATSGVRPTSAEASPLTRTSMLCPGAPAIGPKLPILDRV
jgi:hypothetical protein